MKIHEPNTLSLSGAEMMNQITMEKWKKQEEGETMKKYRDSGPRTWNEMTAEIQAGKRRYWAIEKEL